MINLTQSTINNEVYVYVDTTSVDIPFEEPSFLFGFKNLYTNAWSYVVPTIVSQNARYTVFSINVTNIDEEDQIDGKVSLGPSGSWIYKLWATEEPILDPSDGYLLDQGPMQLISCSDESVITSYISDNDSTENSVYLTRDCTTCLVWSTCPDIFSLVVVKWNECN